MSAFNFGEKVAVNPRALNTLGKSIGNALSEGAPQAAQKAMLAQRKPIADTRGFLKAIELPVSNSGRRSELQQAGREAYKNRVLENTTYAGGAAAGGLGIGIGAGELAQRPPTQPQPKPQPQNSAPHNMLQMPSPAGMIKTQSAREFGAKVANYANNPMAIGAGAGGLLGAGAGLVGGGVLGALNPGYDEEGKRKSRLMAALKGMAVGGLGGGAIGAGVGALGGEATNLGHTLGMLRGHKTERELNALRSQVDAAQGELANVRMLRELHGIDAPSNAVDGPSAAQLARIGAMA